ncbi:hypothetical protein [Acinetobacter calcoaceticus]|uniref:hypothetical protein n=1 Tax=Acinetobacter calcoaceticus TaxID=471 RepID=UPI003008DAD7
MLSFIKRLSILLIYIPALCYGCQLFYYFGLFYLSESKVFSLGLNNYEVTFLGANELLTNTLAALNKIIELAPEFLIKSFYLLFYPFFIWYWWKPETNERKKQKLRYIYYSITCNIKFHQRRNDFTEKLLEFLANSYLILILFTLLIILYLSYYNHGKDDFHKALQIAYYQKLIDNEKKSQQKLLTGIGTLEEGKEKLHVYNLACGHYKCAGIKVNNLEIKTYLPESYSTEIPKRVIERTIKEYDDNTSKK